MCRWGRILKMVISDSPSGSKQGHMRKLIQSFCCPNLSERVWTSLDENWMCTVWIHFCTDDKTEKINTLQCAKTFIKRIHAQKVWRGFAAKGVGFRWQVWYVGEVGLGG